MKLRNKKTGEIVERVDISIRKVGVVFNNDETYDTLAELNEEWEDVPEEPEEYWYIDCDGGILCGETDNSSAEKMMLSMGNHFDSLEEAEKAVEKLKAVKRLEDKGFRPKMWEWEYIYDDNISGELIIKAHIDDATDSDGKYTKDLDLLFGGEE